MIFSRAGFSGQHTVPCHWAGDQQSQNRELKSVLCAGLSAAASGILFWGIDLAGFAGALPTLDLYRRATQMACFLPIMQWHSEPDGGQFRELMPGGEGKVETPQCKNHSEKGRTNQSPSESGQKIRLC